MSRIDKDKGLAPPYLSFKTLLNFLDRLEKVGMPNRIDRSMMDSSSGMVQAQLLTTLKYLHLITGNDGIPTETLGKLVSAKESDKKHRLKEVIVASYPFLFKDGFNLQSATSKEIQDKFDEAGASGGTTRKSVAFFMAAAKHTGIGLSPHIKKFKITGNRNSTPKVKKPASVKPNNIQPDMVSSSHGGKTDTSSWQQLLLSKFPELDPAWPDDVKAKWFDGFKDLMGQFKN